MWTLSKEFKFEAAHRLPLHDGKCQRLHGHSWKMRVIVKGASLQVAGAKTGMLIDFSTISKVVNPLVDEYLDHHYLNETTGLENPTSEELARWVFNHVDGFFNGLLAIEVDETCTCSCRYERTA